MSEEQLRQAQTVTTDLKAAQTALAGALVASEALEASLAVAGPAPVVASGRWGANIQRVRAEAPAKEAGEVAARGGDIRVNVPWDEIESVKGARNWAKLDAIMAALPSGRQACLTVDQVPGWANGGLNWQHAPLNAADYGAFCGLLVGRYTTAKVAAIEVLNEPNDTNLAECLLGTGARSQEKCSGEMYAAAHAAVAGRVPVLAGALYYSPNQLEWLKACLAQAGVTTIDAVSIHPYSDGAAPTNTSTTHSFLGEIEKAIAAFGKPVWLTEFGIRIGEGVASSETARATYLRECFAIAKAHPQVAGAYWYQWRDYPGDTFGLVGLSYEAREPVTKAFAEVA